MCDPSNPCVGAYDGGVTAENVRNAEGPQNSWTEDEPTTFEYIHLLRVRSGLRVGEVARRAGVTSQWLEQFEAGLIVEGINYDQLLALVRATQPERPEWWDCGHEHDLHLPPSAVPAGSVTQTTGHGSTRSETQTVGPGENDRR